MRSRAGSSYENAGKPGNVGSLAGSSRCRVAAYSEFRARFLSLAMI